MAFTMPLRRIAVWILIITLTVVGLALFSYRAGAITSTIATADPSGGFIRLKSGSAKEIIRIQFGSNENGKTFSTSTISFNPIDVPAGWTNGGATSSELKDLATINGGIQLWKGNGSGQSYYYADTQISLAASPVYGSSTFTIILATPQVIATDDTYSIVLQSDTTGITNNRAFTATLAADGIGTTGGAPPTITAVTTTPITIDTTAPTFDTAQTGPQPNSTGVPVQSMISLAFSEAMDPTTLTSSNITMTVGGSAVGIAIRPMFNRANIVVSSAPTYAASSRFAKFPSTGQEAFYFIGSTGSSIFPNGSYTAPTVGDIVFFSHDGFPGEFGLISTSTLTAGTFGINGFSLFGQQGITKLATPAATGLTTASTVVTTGTLMMVNTTANPTASRYDWHVVTKSAAVNSSALLIDDGSAAPTYATGFPASRFSTVAAATTSVDNAGAAGGYITAAVGDLVFAKLTGASSYGWHITTTAGNVSSDATESTVVFNGTTAAASRLTASSTASLITPSAQGAVTESATAFAMRDILFAKTTAGALNNNSYNWHSVSSPATGANSSALRFDDVSSPLAVSSNYVVTIGTGVRDKAGNALASQQTLNFSTGSTGTTNATPPAVTSASPQPGAQTHPLNAPIIVSFSVPMANTGDGSVLLSSNVMMATDNFGSPGTAVTVSRALSADTQQVLTITPASALTANTNYILRLANTTKSSTGVVLPQDYFLGFRTSSVTDTTNPTVMGVFPSNAATGITRSLNAVCAGVSEDMLPTTITSSTVTLSGSISGSVSYQASSRAICFSPSQILAASTAYTFTITTGATDLAGNAIAQNYVSTFTTGNASDSTAPSVQFAAADNNKATITFSEPMKSGGGPNAVDNVAILSLQSPVGTDMSLAGKTVTYDGMTMTATISGLSLVNGNSVLFTVSNLAQDFAGNTISTSGTPASNTAQATVQNSATTGGNLAPGSGTNTQTGAQQGMTPISASPMVRAAGATSGYMIQFPVATSIPVGGKIVLNFPTGFDVTNVTAPTSGFANGDLNGMTSGLVTIDSVAVSATARTVTITTGTAATGANAFIRFEIFGVINSSVPSSSGYTLSITTKDASSVIQESLTSSPFYLGAAGLNALTIVVFNDTGVNGGIAGNNVLDGGEPGVTGANVFLFSPQLGGQQGTSASGTVIFSNLASGDFQIGLDPSTVGSSTVNTSMQPITISASSTKYIGLATAPYIISGLITGPASTSLDVFASSPNGFVMKNVTTNAGGTVTYQLPVSANTTYNVGVGPAMPRANMIPGSAAMTQPTFTFMPPPNISVAVVVANVTGKDFTLSAANKAITGFVRDSGGTGISGANVFARPVESSTNSTSSIGMGAGAQTGSDGSFSIPLIPGSYLLEAFKQGTSRVPAQQVTVPTTGTNTPASAVFVIPVNTTTGLTISGTVTDESGNAIPYSGVSARLANSTSDTSFMGGGGDGMVGGPTDANGKYTLYVKAGTWVIEAFAPGYGRLGSKTVTITDTSKTGQDFSAATISVGTITGTATKNSVAIQGVNVRAEGSAGVNMAVTDTSGAYTLKVPAGDYTVTCFFQGFGEKRVTGTVSVTEGATTSGKNCAMGAPITLTIYLTDGINGISNAFVEARDSSGLGNGTNVSVASGTTAMYTLTVAPGTYTIRAGHPSYGMVGTTSGVTTTSYRIYTASVGAMRAVTGTVAVGGTAIEGAWASLTGTPTGQTNTIHLGGITNSSGAFSISVPDGLYSLRADKPGYQSGSETQVTVAGSAVSAGEITLTTASKTISGTITLNGSAVSNAWVDANNGAGGFAVDQTDSTGAYSLAVGSGNWRVTAHSDGYDGRYNSLVDTTTAGGASGINISLSAISGYTAYAARPETMTPTAGGQITNSDIIGFRMIVPANALGTDSNAATVTTKPNSAMPNPTTGVILSKNAITISAVDSSGEPISSLSGDLQLVIPYTEADLPTGSQETDLVIGYWNESTQTYNTLSTTVDTTNNTLTATVDHLSDFAPLVASDPEAPATPNSFSAANLTNTSVRLVWDAVAAANSYDIYQSATADGTFARVGSEPTVSGSSTTSYDVTGLTPNIKYYWKISSLNASGNESAASNANFIIVGPPSSSNSGGGTSSGGGSSGGGSGVSTAVPITLTPAFAEASAGKPAATTAGAVTFTKVLRVGSENKDVVALQTFLESKGFLKMPAGVAKGYFGNATKSALAKYQVSIGLEAVGELGPATRGKLNAELTGNATPTVAPVAVSASGKTTFTARLRSGSEGADVVALQTILEDKGFLKMPAGVAKGYFGNATKSALAKYQVSIGLEAVGELGPATRAALNH